MKNFYLIALLSLCLVSCSPDRGKYRVTTRNREYRIECNDGLEWRAVEGSNTYTNIQDAYEAIDRQKINDNPWVPVQPLEKPN
jgi:hypothetical protein